jgi:hypothetical protein
MQSQLVHLRYRLRDEVALPRPRSGWIIPVTGALTAVTCWVMAPGHPLIVPLVYTLAVWVTIPLKPSASTPFGFPTAPTSGIVRSSRRCSRRATTQPATGARSSAPIAWVVLWAFFLILPLVLPRGRDRLRVREFRRAARVADLGTRHPRADGHPF